MSVAVRKMTVGAYEVVRRLESPDRELYLARKLVNGKARDYLLALFEVPEVHARDMKDEIARCARLEHEAIQPIVEHFEHDGKQVLVFESVAGASLLRLLRHLEQQGEQLSDGASMYIGKMLMGALSEAHTATDEDGKISPIVHGELGPHQVFISWDGDVKILGFGLGTIFYLSARVDASPEWAQAFVAPEVRSGGMLTPRANAFSAAALVWSLLARKTPPLDGALEPLRELRPKLPTQAASALDRALDISIRKRQTCQAVAWALGRVVKDDDRSELVWSMEVLRALVALDDEVMPVESFPPSSLPALASVPPISSLPPPSDDVELSTLDGETQATTPFFKVPDHLQHIVLPDSVLPPDEDEDEPTTDRVLDDALGAAPKPKPRKPMTTLLGPGAAPGAPPPARKSSRVLKGESVGDVDEAEKKDDSDEADEKEPTRKPISKRSKKALVKKLKRSSPSLKKVSEPDKPEKSDAVVKKAKAAPKKEKKKAKQIGKIRPKKKQAPKRKTLIGAPPAAVPVDEHEELPPEVAPVEPHTPQFPAPRPKAERPEPAPKAAALPEEEPDLGKTLAPPDVDGAPPRRPTPPPRIAIEEAIDEPESIDEVTAIMDEQSIDAIPPPPMFQPARSSSRYPPIDAPPGSHRAPASVYPPIDAPPGSHRAPSSMAPQQMYSVPPASVGPYSVAPGTMAGAAVLPARWLSGVALVIAVTAMASFVLGLVVASGGVQVSVGNPDAPTAAPPAPTTPPAPVEAPKPKPAEPAAKAPAPAPEPKAEPKPEKVHVATLPISRGFLMVTTTQEGAGVYVNGEHVGPTGDKLEVGCGVVFIRLGNTPPPLVKWFGKGRALNVACQGETKMHLEPVYEDEPVRGKKGRWMPGGL